MITTVPHYNLVKMSNKLTDVSFDGKSGRYVSFTMCRTIWKSISVNYSFVPEKIYTKEIFSKPANVKNANEI